MKSDLRICGCGAALATGPINQNKAYFEVKVQCGGKQIQPDTETFLVGGGAIVIKRPEDYSKKRVSYTPSQNAFT